MWSLKGHGEKTKMGRKNIRMETYLDRELADKVESTDQPNSEFIREAIRRELMLRTANTEIPNESKL